MAVRVGGRGSDVYIFFYYHIHHGLTQKKFGSEEVRLAPLTPLPTIRSKTNLVLFCPHKSCFVTPWTSLDRVVEEVPKHEQLFVLMDANARTGRMEKEQMGSKDSKILGAYGRDTLNDKGELLLSFANNHDLALVNTFFNTPKGGVSHTFNGRGKKRIDYILTRQRDRKFVRNVTVHPQPSFLPISDHNIVSAPVKLLGHFA